MKPFLASLCLLLAAVARLAANECLSWNASPTAGVGYNVYWSANYAGPFTLLGSTSGLSLTNATSGNFYYYVTATNAFGESDPTPVAYRPGSATNPKVR